MKKLKMYSSLAKYYHLVYHDKDYEKEAKIIKKLISRYKKSNGKYLLDVACGTGHHLKYLKSDFSCTGVDASTEMLEIARSKVKGVVFKKYQMASFNLNKKFDVITCLFSSIGYVKNYSNLRKTIFNFSNHLKKGGVLLIEPWFTKSQFKTGTPFMATYDSKDLKIARLNISKVKNNISVLDMHYLVAEKGKDVRHYVDRHELGLFGIKDTLKIMRDAGLKSVFLKNGLMKDRGLYVGAK